MPERCRCCHRVITDPESIAAGLGPVCRKKQLIRGEEPALFDLAEYPAIPLPDKTPQPPAAPVRPLLVRFDLFRPPSLAGLSEVEKHRRICETLGLR